MTDFASIGRLVTKSQDLLDSIKGGAIRTMQTKFEEIKAEFETLKTNSTLTFNNLINHFNAVFDGKLIDYQTQFDDLIKPAFTTKNILYNTGHSAVYHPINQHEFDGDWDSLAIGAYGYDGWLKYSDTHKAQIIEMGDFENIDYTLSYNGGEIATISPPSGGNSHWLVAVPFDADKIDLRPAYGKGLWQAESYDNKFNKSLRYYFFCINTTKTYGTSYTSTTWFSRCTFKVQMRIKPSITSDASGLKTVLGIHVNKNEAQIYQSKKEGYTWLKADATLSILDADENITVMGGEHES